LRTPQGPPTRIIRSPLEGVQSDSRHAQGTPGVLPRRNERTSLSESSPVTDTTAQSAGTDEAAMHSIADAMRDAAKTASEHAAKVRQSASEAGPKALETISQMFYMGSYVLAYGVVYATVFVAQSLPQENPIMRGFRDGGQAAVNDLDAS